MSSADTCLGEVVCEDTARRILAAEKAGHSARDIMAMFAISETTLPRVRRYETSHGVARAPRQGCDNVDPLR